MSATDNHAREKMLFAVPFFAVGAIASSLITMGIFDSMHTAELASAKLEAKAELAQAATAAFVNGVCKAELEGCSPEIRVTFSNIERNDSLLYTDGDTIMYKVVMGRVFKMDPNSPDRPKEAILPKACTGAGDDDQSSKCQVLEPEPEATNIAESPE